MKRKSAEKQNDSKKIKEELRRIVTSKKFEDRSKLITYEEAVESYKYIEPKKFGAIETVLLILGITPDKPIKGKTMMMKQIFLSEKELGLDVEDLQFIGHQFGPHSFLMENVLKNMEFIGVVKKQGMGSNQTKYYLTERGKTSADKLISSLSKDEKEILKKYRIAWDELGYDGIIKFVYNHYPDYIDESIIRRRYTLVDWKTEGNKIKD